MNFLKYKRKFDFSFKINLVLFYKNYIYFFKKLKTKLD
jgi:hypothetical protein